MLSPNTMEVFLFPHTMEVLFGFSHTDHLSFIDCFWQGKDGEPNCMRGSAGKMVSF